MVDKHQLIALTDSLLQALEQQSNQQERERIIERIVEYTKIYEQIKSESTEANALRSFYYMIDSVMNTLTAEEPSIKCGKGCAFCCHMNVDVSEPEARLIIEYCEENHISIDTEHLRKQLGLHVRNHHRSEHSKCAFLGDDNQCKIYEVRPLSCRKYVVSGDPSQCDTKLNPDGRVQSMISFDAEMFVSAIITATQNSKSMAPAIIGMLNRKYGKVLQAV